MAEDSWRRVSFILNGHRFQGWSDDKPPIDFPKIELKETKRGADGVLYATDTGIRGGEVTVKLFPTSVSTQRVLKWRAEAQRDRALVFNGSFVNPDTNSSSRMKNGYLKSSDGESVPGKTFMATFEFEQIIPSADSGTFSPRPA